MLVALASLIGKYFRDLFMARVVRYQQRSLPDLPDVSGYHDPITRRFIEASSLVRKRQKLPDDCFVRIKMVATDSKEASSTPRRSRVAPHRAD